jgi:hypothetical protein
LTTQLQATPLIGMAVARCRSPTPLPSRYESGGVLLQSWFISRGLEPVTALAQLKTLAWPLIRMAADILNPPKPTALRPSATGQ